MKKSQRKSWKKRMKRILDWIIFIFTGQGAIAEESVDAGICDFSGQGRDRYGR